MAAPQGQWQHPKGKGTRLHEDERGAHARVAQLRHDVTRAVQALALLAELTKITGTQVLAILAGNDPDSILKCLRGGASDANVMPTFVRSEVDLPVAV